jgi:hypothetical protein
MAKICFVIVKYRARWRQKYVGWKLFGIAWAVNNIAAL